MSEPLILKVALFQRKGTWRRIRVSEDTTLHDLAQTICQSFDFAFDHAFGFYSNVGRNFYNSPRKFELFADMGEGESDALGVKGHTVREAFPRTGAKMLFLFDYGDDWMFVCEREKLPAEGIAEKGPWLIESKGKAPIQYPDPEDE